MLKRNLTNLSLCLKNLGCIKEASLVDSLLKHATQPSVGTKELSDSEVESAIDEFLNSGKDYSSDKAMMLLNPEYKVGELNQRFSEYYNDDAGDYGDYIYDVLYEAATGSGKDVVDIIKAYGEDFDDEHKRDLAIWANSFALYLQSELGNESYHGLNIENARNDILNYRDTIGTDAEHEEDKEDAEESVIDKGVGYDSNKKYNIENICETKDMYIKETASELTKSEIRAWLSCKMFGRPELDHHAIWEKAINSPDDSFVISNKEIIEDMWGDIMPHASLDLEWSILNN